MNFKAKKDFGVDYHKFKAGTTYDSERFGLSEDELKRYQSEGKCEIEDAGEDVAPRRPMQRKKKRVQSED